ncbi:hypothetical protein DFH09DRAFT_1164471, partial [Mycena vulgaris]
MPSFILRFPCFAFASFPLHSLSPSNSSWHSAPLPPSSLPRSRLSLSPHHATPSPHTTRLQSLSSRPLRLHCSRTSASACSLPLPTVRSPVRAFAFVRPSRSALRSLGAGLCRRTSAIRARIRRLLGRAGALLSLPLLRPRRPSCQRTHGRLRRRAAAGPA